MTEVPPPAQPTVDAIWAARERENDARPQYDSWGVSASALGTACDRALWYALRWVSPPEKLTGRKLRIFERGNIEEERVLADLRRAGIEVTREQERFSLAKGWLRGKVDAVCRGLMEAPKALHVTEIKSAKAADFRGIQKHGLAKHKPEHWHQLHAGMAATGIDRGAYVVVNKDTEEIHVERIHLDVEEAARQEARVLGLVEADDAPLRAADSAEAFVCRFCQHKAVCHENAAPRRTCRSCIFWTFGADGNGHCEKFHEPRKPDRQREGAECPAHRWLPTLIAGDQIDAADDGAWIDYRLADGTIWRDGAEENQEEGAS